MTKKPKNQSEPIEIICVACPKGCKLAVERNGEQQFLVNNAECKRGREYGIQEVTDPRRMVATTVRVSEGIHPLVPVYTTEPFPKGKIGDLLENLRNVVLEAPVKQSQVVMPNALGSGIDVIASRDLVKK